MQLKCSLVGDERVLLLSMCVCVHNQHETKVFDKKITRQLLVYVCLRICVRPLLLNSPI